MEYKNLKELKIKENLVLRTVIDLYNKHQHNGEVSVSSSYIASILPEVGSEGNVRKIINKLIDKEILHKVRSGNYAAKSAPVYTINFNLINSMEVEEDMYDDTDVNTNSAEVIRLLMEQNKMLNQLIRVINDKFVAKNNTSETDLIDPAFVAKNTQNTLYNHR